MTIKTSLYDEKASYDREGTTLYDKDGVKVVAWKAENNEYMGPQIAISAYNGGKEPVSIGLTGLKLDGKDYDAHISLEADPGKRCADIVSIDLDYENLPEVKEAEITLSKMDPDTWESAETFAPVKVQFAS